MTIGKMKTNLNIGCGCDYKESTADEKWINIDYNPKMKADIHCSLEKELPVDSESIDHVKAINIFEHIHKFVELMIELHRVMKWGATIEICVPLFPCRASIIDPEHCRFFVEESFHMFTDPNPVEYFRGSGLFEVVESHINVPSIDGKPYIACKDWHTELRVKLKKVKWEKTDKGVWYINADTHSK